MEQMQWEKLTPAEKQRRLFLEQKALLDIFLKNGAITQSQFDKSYGDLKAKMGIED